MAFSNAGINVTVNATNAQAGAQHYAQALAIMNAAINPLTGSINTLNANMHQLIATMQRTGNQARQTANNFAAFTAASVATSAINELKDALHELLVGSTLYAARTEELGIALNAVAIATGTSTQVIRQQELAMKQLNITTQDARQSLSRFLQAGLDITKSGVLARTAQDLAVIAGVSTSEEINKLIIGIQTLQSRNLRTAGVFITVDEVLDRLAKTTHRARDSFSTFEKQQATLNAVLEFGARVTGTYEAAMTTASKQMRSLERVIFEAQNSIGNNFIPVMQAVITSLTVMFELITKYPKTFLLLSAAVITLAGAFAILNTTAIPRLLVGVTSLAAGVRTLYNSIILLPAALTALTVAGNTAANTALYLQISLGGIGAILAAVGIIAAMTYALYTLTDSQKEFIKINDNAISVGIREVESLKARTKALDEYKRSVVEVNRAKPAIEALGGFETTGEGLETSRATVAAVTRDLLALENRKNKLLGDLDRARERGTQVEVDRSYVDVNRIRTELTSVVESITVKSSDLNDANKRVTEFGQAFDVVKNRLSETSSAAGMTVDELARLRDAQKLELEALKLSNPELSKQYALLNNIADAHDRMAKAVENAAKAEEEKLKATGRDVVLNLQLAKSLEPVLEQAKELASSEQAAAQGFGYSITSLEQNIRQALVGASNLNAQLVPLGRLAESGIQAEIKAAGDEFSKSLENITQNNAQFDLFSASLDSVSKAFIRLHPEFDKSRIGTEKSTEALYNYLGGYDKLNQTLPQFITLQGLAAESVRRTEEATRKAALGILDLDEAIKNLRVASYDEVGPGGRLLNLGVALKGQAEQELKRQQRLGALGATVTELPVEFVPQLVRRTEASKQFTEILRKEYGGDFEAAMKEIFEDPLLKEKLGWTGTAEAFKAFMAPIIKEQERAAKAAKDADNVVKSEAEKLKETLRRTKEDIDSFLKSGTPEFKLRMEVEEAERVKKDLESIMTLRHKMGVPLDAPIKLENVMQVRQELEVLAKVFDEIREAQNALREAQLKVGAPVVDAEVRAQTALLKLVRDRRDEEQQLAAEIAVAIQNRMRLESDANEVQRLEARAYLNALNEEQKQEEDLVTSLTRIQIRQGSTAFVENNKFILEGFKTATSPTVSAINDTEATIKKSADEIKGSMVDFSKAFGDSVVRSTDRISDSLGSQTDILRHHSTLLTEIRDKDTTGILPGVTGGATGFSTSITTSASATIERLKMAIASRESHSAPGTGYKQVVGSTNRSGGHQEALGRYGIMDFNVRSYGPKATGQNISKQEFLQNPQLQEVVANYMLSEALAQYKGNEADVLSRWLTGVGVAQARREGRKDKFGTTVDKYLNMGIPLGGRRSSGTAFEDVTRRLGTSGIPVVQPFIDSMSGSSRSVSRTAIFEKLIDTLGITSGAGRLGAFDLTATQMGRAEGGKTAQQLDDLKKTNDELRLNLAWRKLATEQLDKERRAQLLLAIEEEDYNRTQRVRVDNLVDIANQQKILNSLSTDAIHIAEVLQGAELDRLKAEQETQKESIRLGDEQRRRRDPVQFQRDINKLLADEANKRWKEDLDLEAREALLRDRELRNFSTSIEHKARVEREANISRREAAEELNTRLIQLDDELLHHGQNAAFEYAVAWREALQSVREREDEAVKRSLRATAEIADQITYSVQRIRATVLEGINQTEGLSESIGGLFNDTFKVYADDIDRWIDKTTENMGNLGKIFNSFFKSIAHRAIGSIQNSILDVLFPETEAEKQAKLPRGVTTDGSDEIFRGTQEAIAAIGLTSIGAADQISLGTGDVVNSMVRVSYAAEAATAALMRLASASVGGGGVGTLPSLASGIGSLLPSGGGNSAVSSIFRGLGMGGGSITNPSQASSAAIGNIFNRGTGGFAGGFPASMGGFGSLLSALPQLASGAGSSVGTTLATLSSAMGGGTGARGGILSTITGLFSKGGISKLIGSLGSQAPMLGLGLGMGLGGQSGIGSILGGVGGLAGGLGVLAGLGALSSSVIPGAAAALSIGGGIPILGGLFAGLGGSIGGSMGALVAAAGPLAAIAIPLLVGAYFLARNKARRQGEKIREQMSTDIVGRLTQILNDVKADKLDGPQALTQAKQAFDDYRANMANIKDSKTRRHAEQYITSREHPPMLLMDQINAAVSAQKLRQEIEKKQIPTYAMGGIAQSNVIRVSRGERLDYGSASVRIPGQFDGRDDILAFVPRGTRITPPHAMPIYPYAGGGNAGVAPAARASSLSPSGTSINVTAVIVMNEAEARAFLDKVPNSVLAKKVALDAPINPQVLPAAVAENMGAAF